MQSTDTMEPEPITNGGGNSRKQQVYRRFSANDPKELAERVTDTGDDGDLTFFKRLACRLVNSKVEVPAVTVEFKDLSVQVDALVGSAALPTLSNVVIRSIKTLFCLREQQTKKLDVLSGVSGVVKPGRMTLVIAPPGSGKSVFLKMLAGRLGEQKDMRIKGDIKYNGQAANEFNINRTSAYVEQTDDHLGSLTVRETLEFAHKFQVGTEQVWNVGRELSRNARGQLDKLDSNDGIELQEIVAGSKGEIDILGKVSDADFDAFTEKMFGTEAKVDAVIKFLGLTRCQNTWVGDAFTRGVSGGEKKRLTAGEMLVGPKSLFLMDEISTGLDAATLFSVMKWLRAATHTLRLNMVMALVQPPPETFFLFDDIILLSGGKTMFHGPISEAVPFFCSLGFKYPVRKDPASFLQEVTTAEGQILYAGDQLAARKDPKSGLDGEEKLLLSLDEVGEAYWRSETGMSMKADLDNSFNRHKGHPNALAFRKHAMNFWQSTKEATSRQFVLTRRNKIVAKGRIAQVLIMGLLIGSIFWQLSNSPEDARQLFGFAFLSIIFMALGNIIQLNLTMMHKSVFRKHHNNSFFSALSYALSMAITQIPFSFVESIVYTATTYFMTGMSLDGARFIFIFWFGIFTTGCSMASVFRFIACMTPNMVVAHSIGGVVLLMLVVSSGFTIVRKAIPNGWIWAYWISPFSHAVRLIVINEFTSDRWKTPLDQVARSFTGNPLVLQDMLRKAGVDVLDSTVGELALKQFDFYTDRKWIWIGIGYLWGLFIVMTLASAAALHFLRYDRKQAIVGDDAELKKSRAEAVERKLCLQHGGKEEEEGGSGGGNFRIARDLPVQPITLIFQNLSYTVDGQAVGGGKVNRDEKGKLRLIQNITGYACPGVLTALMGGTGAGKTTLMDVIAGRKTHGTIGGEIFVNGHPKDQKTWSRVVGYVEQFDVHSESATVREALEHSSRLRLDETVNEATMRCMVDEVLDIVDLTDLQHSIVGTKEGTGLSLEQAKRLSIAVELVANPSVIFMDEPTSGLDARAAATVMRAVKNISQLNRTIIVTIHQPSIEIFESFDNLLLLQLGGEMTYFGPLGGQSCELIKYLEAIPGVVPIGVGHNPATWMLEVTGGSAKTMADAADADFVSIYKNHELSKTVAQHAADLIKECAAKNSPLTLSHRYAIPLSAQVPVIMSKMFKLYWRSPSYNLVRMMVTTVAALVMGSVYWKRGEIGENPDVGDVQNVMGILFVGMSFMGMINLISSLPVNAAEREVYYRERAASMYSSFPFAVASGVVEVPYMLAQAAVYVPIIFFMLHFTVTAEKFFYFFIVFFLNLSLYVFFGQMLVYVMPIPALATVIGGAVHFLWTLFNGFMISESQIPVYWKWMNHITPTTYIFYGLTVSQLGDNDTLMLAFGEQIPIKEYIRDRFGFKYSFRWWCVAILALFNIFFRVLTMLAMKIMKHHRR